MWGSTGPSGVLGRKWAGVPGFLSSREVVGVVPKESQHWGFKSFNPAISEIPEAQATKKRVNSDEFRLLKIFSLKCPTKCAKGTSIIPHFLISLCHFAMGSWYPVNQFIPSIFPHSILPPEIETPSFSAKVDYG